MHALLPIIALNEDDDTQSAPSACSSPMHTTRSHKTSNEERQAGFPRNYPTMADQQPSLPTVPRRTDVSDFGNITAPSLRHVSRPTLNLVKATDPRRHTEQKARSISNSCQNPEQCLLGSTALTHGTKVFAHAQEVAKNTTTEDYEDVMRKYNM